MQIAPMPLELTLAGEQVTLLGERALYWPARQRLMIADLHLGKADTFRHAGLALPTGGTAEDLARLSALLAQTGAQALWVLGDLLHGRLTDTAWRQELLDWRAGYPALDLAVINGNHDRVLAKAELPLRLLGDELADGPFLLRHAPPDAPMPLHVLCGHLHPLASLPGIRRRWPAFWLRADATVLPAFSTFTAGKVVSLSPGERLVACVEGEAIPIAGRL